MLAPDTHDADRAPHGYRDVFCDNCGYIRKIPIRCSDKTCIPCQRHRAAQIYFRVVEALKQKKNVKNLQWRHIVLTMPASLDLKAALDHIIASFRKLRSTDFWKRNVEGGFFVIEVKPKYYDWHVHLHIVAYSGYLRTGLLAKNWTRSQGLEGKIHTTWVFVRRIKSNEGEIIAKYIGKYISKGSDIPPDMRQAYNRITKGRRLFHPFGSLSLIYYKSNRERPKFPCPDCGNTSWVVDLGLVRLREVAGIFHQPSDIPF
jgi:hypothetical protein